MPHTTVALVTGATGGIGHAVAERLSADGHVVVGTGRSVTPDLEATVDTAIAADLTRAEDVERLVDSTLEAHGRIDVLVNNAGAFAARTDGFAAIGDDDWRQTLDVNLMSAVRTIRAALPALVEAEGAIINVGSIAARLPESPVTDYAAAKAALVNLSSTLAEELAPGVRVNTVSPGPTMTPAWKGPDGFGTALAGASDEPLDAFLDAFPDNAGLSTGRMTAPEEVAEVVALLASGRARNINGANLVVDGGQDKAAY